MKSFVWDLVVCLGVTVVALALLVCSPLTAGGQQYAPSIIMAGPDVVYTRYTVVDAPSFKQLWFNLPHRSIVFWRGLMIQPGLDYNVSGSATIQITDPVAAGDTITIVTLP